MSGIYRGVLGSAIAYALQVDGDKGDLTVSGGGSVLTIDNDVVTYAKIQNVSATDKLLGRSSVGAGDIEEITCTQAGRDLLDDATASDQRTTLGLGALATQGDGDKGDITVATGGTVWTIDNGVISTAKVADDAITYAKIQNVSATDKLLGRTSVGAGDIEEVTCTAAGRALLDDADASAQRTTLGLGTIATQSAASVSITGGSITGITDLAIADGGTGASTAVAAFTNLKQEATDTATGVVELLTNAEYVTGTDTTRVLTAAVARARNIVAGTAASLSGTSVDFTSLPSWVKRVTVSLSGMSTNGTSVPIFQIGHAGGIENTGYVALGGTFAASGATGVLSSTAGFPLSNANTAADVYSGTLILSLLDSATNTWSASGTFNKSNTAFGSAQGAKPLSATLDRIRLTTGAGTDTFDAGSINILYE